MFRVSNLERDVDNKTMFCFGQMKQFTSEQKLKQSKIID